MKVILTRTVENLGDVGDVVSVKDGYGRNYLLPQGLAYLATPGNIARLEQERAKAEERSRRDYLEAKRRAAQLEGVSLVFRQHAGDDGKLFGSVTRQDVTDELNERGLDFEVERRWVMLDEPIKTLGTTPVRVHLHPGVDVEIEVRVEREEG
ncbi:MAG TPA: 50S ribosomal protein L9 [Longimicrobiales bacterium]|nr:50S ribosomal protein L9 [Longimicrobiales bacterium]